MNEQAELESAHKNEPEAKALRAAALKALETGEEISKARLAQLSRVNNEKIRAGASLVQAYTGFIYRGPTFARDVVAELRALLVRDGFANVAQVVGIDARQ